ncbi:hypothetical protein MBLNU230_g5787t1 [Neophaeotheca triangularis]
MASKAPPLDEIQYRRPDIIDFYGGRINENMLHRYISESPFFDHTTNNGLLFGQSRTDQFTFGLVENRQALEDNLKSKAGTEYMVVAEPQPTAQPWTDAMGRVNKDNGVWVVRKQERARDGKLTVLGTYFLIGDNMYQAPSVGDIVGGRLLSATTSLNKFIDKAASLANFTPSTGYAYPTASAKPTATLPSAAPSPSRSREGSIAPGETSRSGSVQPSSQTGAPAAAGTTDVLDARLLANSLQLSIQYGDEYMDENPLIGEPGTLKFTSSTAVVKKRKADEEAAVTATIKAKEAAQASRNGSPAASPKPEKEKPAPPPAVMTDTKVSTKGEKEKKSKMGEKARRRKSRPNAQTPTTPGGALSTTATPSAS